MTEQIRPLKQGKLVISAPWPVSLTKSSEQLSLTKKNRTKIVLNNALLPWRQLPNLPTEHLNNLTWQFRAFAYLTIVQLNIYLIEHWAIEHLSIQHWFTEFRKWSQLTKYINEQCTIEHFRVPIKANSDSNMELSLVLPIHHRSIEHFQSNNSSIFISCRQLGPLCARPGPHVRIFQLSILLILGLFYLLKPVHMPVWREIRLLLGKWLKRCYFHQKAAETCNMWNGLENDSFHAWKHTFYTTEYSSIL